MMNTYSLLMKMQNGRTTLRDSLTVLTKLNIALPCDLAIMFQDMYPMNLKMYVYTKT